MESQFVGDLTTAEMGTIAEPAVSAALASAELMNTGRQLQANGTFCRRIGLGHVGGVQPRPGKDLILEAEAPFSSR